jgi:long-chain acyl-CoA synthetase
LPHGQPTKDKDPRNANDVSPDLLLKHATERPSAPAMREKEYGIWQATPGRTWPRWWNTWPAACTRPGLRRGEHMVVSAPTARACTPPCWRPSRWARFRLPLYQDAVAAECVFPINNAEVRFAFAEDQEQVDKLLEIREQCPQLIATSTLTTRAACATTTSRPGGAGRTDRRRQGFAAEPGLFRRGGRKGQPDDVAAMFFTSGTTGNPKGVVHTHNTLLNRGQAGAEFDKLTSNEEVLAYLPPAWIGQNIFSYAQWLACGYVVNCPESAATVTIDLKEVGPTYYFAPPRVFEGLLTSVMIRMEDAGALKRKMFQAFMDVAKRVGPA